MSLATLPSAIDDWSVVRIAAGLWLSEAAGPVPARVLALPPETGRPSVVVDAGAPSPGTDRLVAELFPALSSAGLTAVRLVLSFAADRYAPAARAHGFDLIAAEAEVTITPHGYALVRPAESAAPGAAPQWRRCFPDGERMPAGMLSPSPAWERGLDDELTAGPEPVLAVYRIPAGLAVRPPGLATGFVEAARGVWPDPERLIVVVDETADAPTLLDGLMALLRRLPLAAAGVRLWWPRAPARAGARALQELARRCGTSLIAPAADVSVDEGFGGICHGPLGAAPWLQFTPAGATQLMGSLYPEPAWERALADLTLPSPPGLVIEQVAAGLCVYRPDDTAPSLPATARSLIPDPARATIIAGGDAMSAVVRQDLDATIGALPAAARHSLRIVLTAAGSGGEQSYAQSLADTFESAVVAPMGTWTATPDGRLLARSVAAAARGSRGSGSEASGWREFSPRYLLSTRQSGGVGGPDRAAGPPWQAGQQALHQPERAVARSVPGQPVVSRTGQPAASWPAPVQPSVRGPAPGGPVSGEPGPSEPGHWPVQPVPVQPGPVQSGPSEPGPWPVQPGVSWPGPDQPAPVQPGRSEPGSVQPETGQPGGSWVAPGQSTASRPVGQPGQSRPEKPGVPEPGPASERPGYSRPGPDEPGPSQRPAVLGTPGQPRSEDAALTGGTGDHPAPEPQDAELEAAEPEGSPRRLPLLARDHRSSAEERRLYRESARSYQTHAVTARRMLTQRPGLRAVAAGEPVDAVITDFAAVLDFLGDDPRSVADALRSVGTAGDPRVACILSGLRRLPSFAGAVFSSARSDGWAAQPYVPCRILIEPSFVSATSSVLVAMEGDINYVIWSQTGKRVAALAADAGRDEILFAAGTTYKILGVYEGVPGSRQMTVFLREISGARGADSHHADSDDLPPGAAQADEQPDDMDTKVLERLSSAASLRDDALADPTTLIRRAGSPMPPIGLDSNSVPFAEALGA